MSRECKLFPIYRKYIEEYGDNVNQFLFNVAERANVVAEYGAISHESELSTGEIFQQINFLKQELAKRLEHEGREAGEKESQMIRILEDTLPDMIISFCSAQRRINNVKQLHGSGGHARKSRKRTIRRRRTGKNKRRL